MQPKY